MRGINLTACIFVFGAWSVVYADPGDTAYAPLGTATRFTNLNGSVGLEEGTDGVQINNALGGLDPKKKYDLYLLTASCPARAELDDAGIKKLKQAAKTGRKLATIDSSGKQTPPVKGLAVKSLFSKGLLISQGGKPIECADIAPTSFGPPPAPPPGDKK